MTTISVAPNGYDLSAAWETIPGATSVEIAPALITVAPVARAVTTTVSPLAVDGGYRVSSADPVRAFGFSGLASGDQELAGDSDLSRAGLWLVIAASTAGRWVPAYAAPAQNLPVGVVGVSLSSGAVQLPDAGLGTYLIALTNNLSGQLATAPISLTGLSMTTVIRAADVNALLDNNMIWSAPGVLTQSVRTDLAAQLQLSLARQVTAGASRLHVPLQLRSSISADVDLTWSGPHGAVVRTVPVPVVADLVGDPVSLSLSPNPPAELPQSVTADVTVIYSGMRLHDVIDDQLPPDGPVFGRVVEADAATRVLPPAALTGCSVVRIGIVGRATAPTDLSVSVVDASGQPIGASAAVSCAAAAEMSTVWAVLPAPVAISGPVNISVRASRGRFLWAGDPDPLVRIVIADPAPGNRTIQLDGQPLSGADGTPISPIPIGAAAPASRPGSTAPAAFPPVVVREVTLPSAAFAGRTPQLSSSLFLSVRFDRLTLRYAR
jgi:hypothetical protein